MAKAFEREAGCAFGGTSADGVFSLFETSCVGMNDQEPAAIINGVRHAMRPGVIVMIYPNEPHLYAADQRNPYTVYHVHIDCAAGIPQIFPRTVRAAALDRNSLAGFQRLALLERLVCLAKNELELKRGGFTHGVGDVEVIFSFLI